MKNLGEQIYFYRTQCGLSQLDIAEKLDVSRQSVSKWENNSATPELAKLVKLCELFGITLDELINGVSTIPEVKEEEVPQTKPETHIARQIFAVLFMLLGCVSLFFYEPRNSFWLFVPLLTTGLLLLKQPNRTGLICAWTWFLSLDTFFLMVGSPYREGIQLPLYVFFLIIMIIVTLVSFRETDFHLTRKAQIFLAVGVPVMPALGVFFHFYVSGMTVPEGFLNLRTLFAELIFVDLFLAAFVICLVPTVNDLRKILQNSTKGAKL